MYISNGTLTLLIFLNINKKIAYFKMYVSNSTVTLFFRSHWNLELHNIGKTTDFTNIVDRQTFSLDNFR